MKRKRKGSCLGTLLKMLIILMLIIASIYGIIVFINNKKYRDFDKEVEAKAFTIDYSKFYDNSSDIQGLTVKDKIDMGLDPSDGSDTDGDGLTDKEEIEIYHTDPLKASSSGDNLPDGYKVANSLDLTKNYGTDTFVGYIGESCTNINIKDKTAENASCYIDTKDFSFNGIEAIIAYEINDYKGNIEIDFSNYITSNSNDREYKVYLITDGYKNDYTELKLNNGKVNVKIDNEYVTIALFKDIEINDNIDIGEVSSDEFIGNAAIIVYQPIKLLIDGQWITVFEVGKGSDELRGTQLSSVFTQYYGCNTEVKHYYIDKYSYKLACKIFSEIASTQAIKNMLEAKNIEYDNDMMGIMKNIMPYIFNYTTVEKGVWASLNETDTTDTSEQRPGKYITTFNVHEDAFPFPNLTTNWSNGVCAGIATVTAKTFAGDYIPIKSNNSFSMKNIHGDDDTLAYDFTEVINEDRYVKEGSRNLQTLFDKGLHDYKYYDYYDDKDLTDPLYLNEEDEQFSNMLSYYWHEYNQIDDSEGYNFWAGKAEYSQIEALKNFFEHNNEIVSVTMFKAQRGHAINAYGIEEDAYDPDVCYILTYDNNIPDGQYKGEPCNNYIKICKKHKKTFTGEDKYYYTYYYKPVEKAKSYVYTSDLTLSGGVINDVLQLHGLIFVDKNYNIIK